MRWPTFRCARSSAKGRQARGPLPLDTLESKAAIALHQAEALFVEIDGDTPPASDHLLQQLIDILAVELGPEQRLRASLELSLIHNAVLC